MYAISGNGIPVDLYLEIRLADNAVGNYRGGFNRGNVLKILLYLDTGLLDRLQIRTFHLDTHRGTHTGLKHDNPRRDRLKFRSRRHTREAGRFDYFLPDIIG